MRTSSVHTFQTPSNRRAVIWGLIVIAALLLMLGARAPFGSAQDEYGSQGAAMPGLALSAVEGSGSAEAQSPSPNIQMAMSSRTINYTYDAAGRLASVNYGGGAGMAYTYDAAGNLVGVSPGGGYSIYLPLVLRGSP